MRGKDAASEESGGGARVKTIWESKEGRKLVESKKFASNLKATILGEWTSTMLILITLSWRH